MFETIAIILIVLWLLGVVSGYTMGNFIYVLLVIAIVLFLVRLISGTTRRLDDGGVQIARLMLLQSAICIPHGIRVLTARAPAPSREDDRAGHGEPRVERLAEDQRAEHHGDHRVDVRVERHRRDRQVLQRVRVRGEAGDRADEDQIAQRAERPRRERQRRPLAACAADRQRA